MRINIDGYEIDIIYEYKPLNRGVYISYKGDNTFKINGFFKYNESKIKDIVLKNKDKLIKVITKHNNKQPKDIIHYLGREYKIILKEDKYNMVSLVDNNMIVSYKNEKNIKKIIREFYTDSVKEYVLNKFDEIFNKFSDLNIKKPSLKFKYTTSFYGKCFTRDNLIEISGMCMKMEPIYIDCVIMHELCHFKYQNHQRNFYDYFETKMPNCKKIQHAFRNLKYQDIY